MSVLKNIINKTKNIIKDIITNIHNKIFKNKYILRVIRILLTIAFVVFWYCLLMRFSYSPIN